MIQPYQDSYGLINCDKVEKVGFNSALFSAEYAIFSGDRHFYCSLFDHIELNLKDNNDIYKSTPDSKEYISHDNLTAMASLSVWQGATIWEEVKRQKGRYDNINPMNPSWSRFLHPRDLIYYAFCACSKWSNLFLPFLLLCGIISLCSSKTTTSGKLLTLLRFFSQRQNWFMNISLKLLTFQLRLMHNQSWTEIAMIYFKQDAQHPVVRALYNLYGV